MDYRKFLQAREADLRSLKELLSAERAKLKEAEASLKASLEAQSVLQAVAAGIQQCAHQRIAAVVTRCLQTVFDDPYEFKIQFEQKRGKTEARMVFCRGGREVDPKLASGGGVMDVAAFALRLAALMLTKPQGRKFLILDEPFKMLARVHGPKVKELIETLAREMQVQFVIITHDTSLQAGSIVEID